MCAVCAHTDRAAIEVAAKNSIAIAARKHLVDPEVLRRHVREHVVRANEGEEPALDVDALVHARAALSRARKLRQEVYDNPEASVYDKQVASKHEHGAIKLLSDVEGARDLSETQILRSPAWARIEAALGQVLARHPDVAKELGDVLSELDCAPSAAEAA